MSRNQRLRKLLRQLEKSTVVTPDYDPDCPICAAMAAAAGDHTVEMSVPSSDCPTCAAVANLAPIEILPGFTLSFVPPAVLDHLPRPGRAPRPSRARTSAERRAAASVPAVAATPADSSRPN
jgi:hypothetical protein